MKNWNHIEMKPQEKQQILFKALKKYINSNYDDSISYYNLIMDKFSHLNSITTGKHGLSRRVHNIEGKILA